MRKADRALTPRARELRRNMVTPERLLWRILRDRRLGGLKFRRQVPIDRYVADYYCAERGVIVELDGMSHLGRVEADRERQTFLESRGLRVIRIPNDAVLHNLEGTAEWLLRQINTPTHPLSPPGRGPG